jgi:hypothetical protein
MRNIILKEDNIDIVDELIVIGFLNGFDGWAPPCPYHPVPRIRCKYGASYKQRIPKKPLPSTLPNPFFSL